MKRTLFTILAAISLLLCVATVGLWVRSYWVTDRFVRKVGFDGANCIYEDSGSSSGSIFYSKGPSAPQSPDDSEFWRHEQTAPFSYNSRFEYEGNAFGRWFHFPIALLAIVFGVIPAFWLFAAIRGKYRWRNRALLGCCPACGYDLRATPERCPECGTIPRMKDEG